MTDTTVVDNQAGEVPELVNDVEAVNEDAATVESTEEVQDADKEQAPKKEKEPWPKSAVNALNHHKADKRELKAANRRLEERIRELEALASNSAAEPDVSKFDSFIDYNDARTKHLIDKAKNEMVNSSQIESLKAQQQQMQMQRMAYVAEVANETAKDLPDLTQVISQYSDVIEQADPAIKEIITDMDNPSLAVYTLAKMGKLENVLYSNPALAAQYLAQAELLGTQHLNEQRARKVTKAPEPMRGAKGVGNASKSTDSMSGEELLRHFKLKK